MERSKSVTPTTIVSLVALPTSAVTVMSSISSITERLTIGLIVTNAIRKPLPWIRVTFSVETFSARFFRYTSASWSTEIIERLSESFPSFASVSSAETESSFCKHMIWSNVWFLCVSKEYFRKPVPKQILFYSLYYWANASVSPQCRSTNQN